MRSECLVREERWRNDKGGTIRDSSDPDSLKRKKEKEGGRRALVEIELRA